MPRRSAGILLFRKRGGELEVLLMHPGGPFWRGKDLGAWSVPKGEVQPAEDPLAAARREFLEETGSPVDGEFLPLTPVIQRGGKAVLAWAVEGDLDPSGLRSNSFSMEWPPKSGLMREFPEVDRAEWLPLETARARINPAQQAFLSELASLVG